MQTEFETSKRRIGQVLKSFNIGHGDIVITPGPSVTLYEFTPEIGVRMSKIRNLRDEFTIALGSGNVRVIAPIPERGTVGIEVPNKERANVPMSDMLNSVEYQTADMELPLALGRTVDNSIFMADLAKMPHLLVAGATGMGKSVGLNAIISSLINKLSPDELKLVLIDPKQVEFSVYEQLEKPYLSYLEGMSSISTSPEEAQKTLDAVIKLMEKRYSILNSAKVRNIQEYNRFADEKLPYYVVIIDEYGDLILQGGKDMETAICRIAQKARAVGIHMIIATQRPDTKIVTGNIKANFPTRIAFRTTTGTDSRVILDKIGAERLTGRGDMLFFAGGDTIRVQCAYISTDEVGTMCHEISAKYKNCEPLFLGEPKYRFTHVLDITYEILESIYEYHSSFYHASYPAYKNNQVWTGVLQLQDMGILGTALYSSKIGVYYPVLINDKDEILNLIEHFYDDVEDE